MKKVISILFTVLCTFSLCFSSYAVQAESNFDTLDEIGNRSNKVLIY